MRDEFAPSNNYSVRNAYGDGLVGTKQEFSMYDLPTRKGLFDDGRALANGILSDIAEKPATRWGLAGILSYAMIRILGGLQVENVHAMGHESGIEIGGEHLRLPIDGLSVYYGDNMAIIGNTQSGVTTGIYMAPGLTMIDNQPLIGDGQFDHGYRPVFDLQSEGVSVEHIDDGEKPPLDRYAITFGPDDWKAARTLVMRSGQRNGSLMMLNRLEEVAGYGSTGQLFVDVTPDFSGQNAEVKIWGIGESGEDGQAKIIDLGSKHVNQYDIFPTSQAKEAVLIPVASGGETVIMVMPSNLTNPELGEDGVWRATDSSGKEHQLVNGSWVEAAPSAEQLWEKEVKEWGLDPEKFTPKYIADGTMVIYDNETNKPVYAVGTGVKTETGEEVKLSGHWELEYAKDMIANSGMCYKSQYKASASGVPAGKDENGKNRFDSWWNTEFLPLSDAVDREKMKHEFTGNAQLILFLGGPDNCWGITLVKDVKKGTQQVPKVDLYVFDKNKDLIVVQVYDGQYIHLPVAE